MVESLHQLKGMIMAMRWVLCFLSEVPKSFLITIYFYALIRFQATLVLVLEVNIEKFVFEPVRSAVSNKYQSIYK